MEGSPAALATTEAAVWGSSRTMPKDRPSAGSSARYSLRRPGKQTDTGKPAAAARGSAAMSMAWCHAQKWARAEGRERGDRVSTWAAISAVSNSTW